MSHHQLRFERRVELERRGNDDHKSRCAERTHKSDRAVVYNCDETEDVRRNQSYESKIDCAEKRDPVADLSKIICSRTTGSDAGDKSAVLLNVLRNIVGIKLNGRVEVCEEYNENCKEQRIKISVCGEPRREDGEFLIGPEQSHDKLRERQNRVSEDERKNAGAVYLDGDKRRLSAVHLSALNLLCILNGDFSLRHIYGYDAREDDKNCYEEYQKSDQCVHISGEDLSELIKYGLTCRRENTYENKKGDTVSYSELGDSFADPHRESGTCAEDYYYTSIRQPFELFAKQRRINTARAYRDEDRDRLDYGKSKRNVSGNLGNLFLSFFTALGKSFKRGNTYAKKLNDNGRIDVRSDTHCE